jgi:hypothetical protein
VFRLSADCESSSLQSLTNAIAGIKPHSQCEAYNADETRLTLWWSAFISMYFMSGDSLQLYMPSRFPRSYNVVMVKGYTRAKTVD